MVESKSYVVLVGEVGAGERLKRELLAEGTAARFTDGALRENVEQSLCLDSSCNGVALLLAPPTSQLSGEVTAKLCELLARLPQAVIAVGSRQRAPLALAPRIDRILEPPTSARSVLDALELVWWRETERRVLRFAFSKGLSPRERNLLVLAYRGMNNDEAASGLHCSRATVATYWNRIFRKVGLRTQRDVLVRACSAPALLVEGWPHVAPVAAEPRHWSPSA